MASLVTVQMQGLVAGDESGPVSVANPPDLTRFKTVVDKKSTVSAVPFTITPPTTDANVYMDEFVWALNQKLPGIFGTNPAQPTFLDLDNEPELWNSTHLEVQGPNPVTSDNYIAKTIALTQAIKDQFPNTIIFGPVHYGFQGIYNWQGELAATPSGANWFPDKYLQAIKTASTTYGKPLVDVYDFHWYAEDYDANGTRILDLTSTTLTDAQVQLIVQSPRNLWDPTYTDAGNSNPWIYQELGNTPINILGRLQSKINAENPGMKISVSEYESGGQNHIAGTIAQADNLGIFGAQGVFAASFWPPNGTYSYSLAGFRAFRGFDGASATFGDTSLQSTSSNVQNVVVYASTDSTTPGRVVFVAINRSTTSQVTAITGQPLSGTAHLYQMTADLSPNPIHRRHSSPTHLRRHHASHRLNANTHAARAKRNHHRCPLKFVPIPHARFLTPIPQNDSFVRAGLPRPRCPHHPDRRNCNRRQYSSYRFNHSDHEDPPVGSHQSAEQQDQCGYKYLQPEESAIRHVAYPPQAAASPQHLPRSSVHR